MSIINVLVSKPNAHPKQEVQNKESTKITRKVQEKQKNTAKKRYKRETNIGEQTPGKEENCYPKENCNIQCWALNKFIAN